MKLEPEDRQPCWYVNFNDEKYTLGYRYPYEKPSEHELKVPNRIMKNVYLFATISSADFAIDLLNEYRLGGVKAAKKLMGKIK